MTTVLYFVSALVMLNNTPSHGWVQYTNAYRDKAVCEKFLKEQSDTLSLSLASHFGKVLVSIKEFECITREEAVKRNTVLGHSEDLSKTY